MALSANAQGKVTHTFQIPDNVPTGARLFEIKGEGGSVGQAIFTGGRNLKAAVLNTRLNRTGNADPVAQTFTPDNDRFLAGIDLIFQSRGYQAARSPVTVQLRETLVGFPTPTVLAEATIPWENIYVTPASRSVVQPLLEGQWIRNTTGQENIVQPASTLLYLRNGNSSEFAYRTLLKFDLPPDLANADIVSATLEIVKHNAAAMPSIRVHRVSKQWYGSQASWNKATTAANWDAAGGDFVVDGTDPSETIPSGEGKRQAFNVTNIVQQWANGEENLGFLLKFANETATSAVNCQIRNGNVAYRPVLKIQYATDNGSGSAVDGRFTRALFNTPVHVMKGREYCFVALTDDPNHALAMAAVGGYVQPGNGPQVGNVTSNPFPKGNLLTSTNGSTWTPHDGQALAFRLLACNFTSPSRTIHLGTFTGTNISDALVQASVYRPTAETDVQFKVTVISSGAVYTVSENELIELTALLVSESIKVDAVLTGTQYMSPILLSDSLFIKGNISATGNYVTRAFEASLDFNVHGVFSVAMPGGSSVSVEVEVHKTIAGVEQNNGDGSPITEWLPVSIDTSLPARDLGDGYTEFAYKRTGLRGVGPNRYTRVRITLSGTPSARPKLKDLKVFTKLP